MKLIIVLSFLYACITALEDTGEDENDSMDQETKQGDQMTSLVNKLHEIQKASGGLKSPIPKILNYVTGVLLKSHKDHSIFIASQDGMIHHGGVIGELVGATLGIVGMILGGKTGLCGGRQGVYMHQHEGLLGFLFDLLGPELGPLASDETGHGLIAQLFNTLHLGSVLTG